MLRNAAQVFVCFGLLCTAVCPCLAQGTSPATDSQHTHIADSHYSADEAMVDCHGTGGPDCCGLSAMPGVIGDALAGNHVQLEDDDVAGSTELVNAQVDLTHHGGSPPIVQVARSDTPITRKDRLIE